MPLRALLSLVPLSLVAGTAAWCSRAVLDLVATADGGIRLALFPPLITWPATVLLFLAAAWGWLRWIARRRRKRLARAGMDVTRAARLAPTSLLSPLYASAVLVMPWLPVLPDVLTPLRLLAGPLASVFWGVLGGLVIVASVSWVREDPSRGAAGPVRVRTLAVVFVLTFAAIVAGAGRITRSPFSPSGDEPHYLIIAQSVLRDRDLRIENNHARGDYREYFDRDLTPHYLTRGVDGEIYSIHPVGLPVLIAPIYAAGGYRLVVLFLAAIGAAAATLGWRLARELTGRPEDATLAWVSVALGVPFLFNAFSVYPEIVGALLVAICFATGTLTCGREHSTGRYVLAGICLAALPWLATKYSFMTAALALVLAGRIVWPVTGAPVTRSAAARRLTALLVPGAISAVAWLAFFNWIWGRPSPAAPYGAMVQTSPRYLSFGAPGLLFDQEYGIAALCPAVVLGMAGLWRMWRSGGLPRRTALEVGVVFAALLAAVGAFRLWWGDAWPGRPVIAGILLWMLPIAWIASEARSPAQRAWAWLLALASAAFAVVAFSVGQGALVASTRDGLSRLLQWLGGVFPLSSLAPSYIAHHYTLALPVTAVWLLAFALATWACGRLAPRVSLGRGAAWAAAAAVGAVVVSASLVAVVFAGRLGAAPPIGAASRSALLDAYSSSARPSAVFYHPFNVESADVAVTHVRFLATPGLRTDPQPVPVLLNMRLNLPAGRYKVSVAFAPLPAGSHWLALRVGRVGAPLQVFDVPSTGGSWSGEFDLPITANFVGFEASPALREAAQQLEVTPLSVVDASRRASLGEVLAAALYPAGHVFAHDETTWLERDGVWVAAQRWASLTTVPREDGPLTLRLRNGPVANAVAFQGQGWQERVTLAPDERRDVTLPRADADRPFTLRVRAEQGFVPAEQDRSSRDRRLLGVFLEFPGSEAGGQ